MWGNNELAAELQLNYKTVLNKRHYVQANGELEKANTPLPDSHSDAKKIATEITEPTEILWFSIAT